MGCPFLSYCQCLNARVQEEFSRSGVDIQGTAGLEEVFEDGKRQDKSVDYFP